MPTCAGIWPCRSQFIWASGDTGKKRLVSNEAARRQGKNRHERGLNAFNQGKTTAHQQNWQFNWQLVEVPNVGHSSKRMLAAPEALEAFGLRALEQVE